MIGRPFIIGFSLTVLSVALTVAGLISAFDAWRRPWQLEVVGSAGPLMTLVGLIASMVFLWLTFRSRGPIIVWVSDDRIAPSGNGETGVVPLARRDRPGADVRRFAGVLYVRGSGVSIPLRWFAPEDRQRLIRRFDRSSWPHRRGDTTSYGRLVPRMKVFW